MPQATSRFAAYLDLLRVAGACAAVADVAMGFLLVHALADIPWQWPTLALLLIASFLLYSGGAVLDQLYRKQSGSSARKNKKSSPPPQSLPFISTALTMRLGFLFLFNGVMLAAAAGWMHSGNLAPPWRCGVIALLLASVQLLHAMRLGATPLAPITRGLFRFLNVLLGMGALGIEIPPESSLFGFHSSSWLAAAGLALYEAGVAWFERSSSGIASPALLRLTLIPMAIGLALLGTLPLASPPGKPLVAWPYIGYVLFGLLCMPLARRVLGYLKQPEPVERSTLTQHLSAAVIGFDAVATVITSGPMPAALIALLFIPNFALSRVTNRQPTS